MSLSSQPREGCPCPSIRYVHLPCCPDTWGKQGWTRASSLSPAGVRLYSPLTLCSKNHTFITWLSLQLGPKDVTERDCFAKKWQGDKFADCQGNWSVCLASRLLKWTRISGMRKETFPLSWTWTVQREFKLPNVCGVRSEQTRCLAALTQPVYDTGK